MSDHTLIHIVPALRPQADGAGEYALNLALALRQSHGIQSRFLVCDPERDGPGRIEDFVVQRLRVRSEACIWSLLASAKEQSPVVLLHYCAYGYHKQGVPLWLYQGINSWLVENGGFGTGSDRKFCTVFYEVMAPSAKPWKKEFCLRIPQKWLISEIHRRSKLSVTGNAPMQSFLDGVEPGKILRLPVLTNLSVGNEHSLDWKALARQYQAALFRELSCSKTNPNLNSAAVEELKGPPPTYAPARQAKEHRTGIRPRPARVGWPD